MKRSWSNAGQSAEGTSNGFDEDEKRFRPQGGGVGSMPHAHGGGGFFANFRQMPGPNDFSNDDPEFSYVKTWTKTTKSNSLLQNPNKTQQKEPPSKGLNPEAEVFQPRTAASAPLRKQNNQIVSSSSREEERQKEANSSKWQSALPTSMNNHQIPQRLDDYEVDIVSTNAEEGRIKAHLDHSESLFVQQKLKCPDPFSKALRQFYFSKRQSKDRLKNKVNIWTYLDRELRPRLPRNLGGEVLRTQVFGSTLTGFGSYVSDMDLCLYTMPCAKWNELSMTKKRTLPLDVLYRVRKLLRNQRAYKFYGDMMVIPAKVPILKIKDRQHNIEVDIAVNQQNGARNTILLYNYARCDPRVAPLVILIKAWAKYYDVNDASLGTLSSYTIALMVLHYLQAGVSPPVIPCLHLLFPSIFRPESDVFDFRVIPEDQIPISENTMTIGQLVRGFFKYYNETFDFTRDVGSVRTGYRLDNRICEEFTRTSQVAGAGGAGQWSAHVCMEEPFDRSNVGRAVCRRPQFEEVLVALKDAYENLKAKKLKFIDIF